MGVELIGTDSYTVTPANDTVQLNVAEILNNSTTITTGTLRLELWLTTVTWSSATSGYEIATDQLTGSSNGTLGPEQDFLNIAATVAYVNQPPAGTYYVTLVIGEYTGASPNIDNGFQAATTLTFPDYLLVNANGALSQGGSTMPVTVNVQNVSVAENTAIAASSLITSISNPDGDSITEYAFWDSGAGNGHFSLNGVSQADGQWIVVGSGNLASLQYVGGAAPGSETLDVEAYDATAGTWTAYSSLTATTTAPHIAPTVSVQNVLVAEHASIAASSLITAISNPSGDNITEYGFWDYGDGTGHFALNGTVQSDGEWITVTAAQLNAGDLVYVGGTSPGNETLFVEVYDASTSAWSAYSQLTATTTHAAGLPVVTVQNESVNANASFDASSIITSVVDPNGYAITSYDYRDDGGGSGYFSLNGVKQADGQWITVTQAELNAGDLVYVGGPSAGSDTVDAAAWDGYNWSYYQTATITTQAASLPVITVQNETVSANQHIDAASIITSVTDPTGYAITYYDYRDDGGGSGYFSLNGVKQADGQWITVTQAELNAGDLVYVGGPSAGSDTVDAAAWDGYNWSYYQTATITTRAASLPVITVQNETVNANAAIKAASIVTSVSDPNGYAITSYDFRDDGGGSGYFSLDGAKQADGQWITITAAQLATGDLTYVGGSTAGSDTVDAAASDGVNWSYYQTASITTRLVAPAVLIAQGQTVAENTSFDAASLINSVTDPNNLAITSYQFRDDGGGNGYFSLNDVKQSDGQWIVVTAAQLAAGDLAYIGGSAAGSDTVDVEASNGYVWSNVATTTVITTPTQNVNPPVVTVLAQTVIENDSIDASSLIASVSDPNNRSITYYDFRDDGGGAGYFQLDGNRQDTGTWITVTAAALAAGDLIYVGGGAPSTETVDVAVYDGAALSNTVTTTIVTVPAQNVLPVIAVHNESVNANASIEASSIVTSVSDPNGYAITYYDFRDDGGGSGYFSLNGVKQADGVWITVTQAQLNGGDLTYVGGPSAGGDTVDAAAWDGYNWSYYQTATITTQAVSVPVIAVQNETVAASASIQASSLITSVSDPNGTITFYEFRDDGGGTGYFELNGTQEADNQWITVSAAQFTAGDLTYVGGATAGSDTVEVTALAGTTASNDATAVVTTLGPPTQNAVINELQDPGIKADVTALLENNSLSYDSMLKILQDVEANGTVTATEFSDLQTLVGSFNKANGISVSAYVANISTKLVDGDPANATWTGGTSTPVALGNLAAGSSQTQLNELIQKWFLGGDLPDPNFEGQIAPISYVADNNPLFNNTDEPSVTDINQGCELGDCYLLASLAGIATFQPHVITSMITDNGNGTYGIEFYINGTPEFVTVNTELPEFTNGVTPAPCNSGPDIWASLIEKAYAQLNSDPGYLPYTAGDEYALIAGGFADPITEITGRAVTSYHSAAMSAAAWAALQPTIAAAIESGEEVDFASYGNTSINGQIAFDDDHMYAGLGYDSTTGDFIVRNPWGTENGQDWLTQFEASMADMQSVGGILFVADGGSSSGGLSSAAPVEALSIQATTSTQSTLVHPGTTVTITLTLGDAEFVTGTPELQLNDNEIATYSGGSGTDTLTFTYTVQAGDNTPDLQVAGLDLPNGAMISDQDGNSLSVSITGDLGIEVESTVIASSYVTQVYAEALLRDPDSTELNNGVTELNVGTITSAQFALDIASSSEAVTDVLPIVRLYEGFLDRAPDPGGLSNWVNVLRNGSETLSQIAAGFAASQEFANDFGTNLSPTAFVTNLYLDILGREPDPTGLSNWVTHINNSGGMTPTNEATVALGFTQSAEYQNDSTTPIENWLASAGEIGSYAATISGLPNSANNAFVTQVYDDALFRSPATSELISGDAQLINGVTQSQLALDVASSTEAQTDVLPIARLYEGFLDRAPDPGGLSNWVNILRGGSETLTQIAAGFAASQEFANDYGADLTPTAFVTALYNNVLGRAPDSGGLTNWVNLINSSGGMTVANEVTVALGFTQSAEYINDSTAPIESWLANAAQTGTYASIIDGLPNAALLGVHAAAVHDLPLAI